MDYFLQVCFYLELRLDYSLKRKCLIIEFVLIELDVIDRQDIYFLKGYDFLKICDERLKYVYYLQNIIREGFLFICL